MPKITLTDFVDIVTSSGVPKATKIAQIKSRPEYGPEIDFYKPLREAIRQMHKVGHSKTELDRLLSTLTDRKKLNNYPPAIAGYKKWLGRKSVTWFEPPRAELSGSGVDVVINPELGLEINGQRHLVKLYFKAEKISKRRVDVICAAMEDSLRPKCKRDDVMTVVDVRRARSFDGATHSTRLSGMVGAELAYIAHLWPHV